MNGNDGDTPRVSLEKPVETEFVEEPSGEDTAE